MKRFVWVFIFVIVLMPAMPVAAQTVPVSPLVFRETKLKGQDFIVLEATTDKVQLDQFWLGYSSSLPLDDIEPEYRLGAATLDKGDAILLVNDDSVPPCDADFVMAMPVDLAETKGTVGLWQRSVGSSSNISYVRVDSFSWSTAATAKADIVRPDSVEKGLMTPVWFRDLKTDVMTWKVGDLTIDEATGCVIKTSAGTVVNGYPDGTRPTPPTIETIPNTTTPSTNTTAQTDTTQTTTNASGTPAQTDTHTTPPSTGGQSTAQTPATTTQTSSETKPIPTEPSQTSVPTTEIPTVLKSPEITELLPNPVGTGTDATDEFIELYNPNDTGFSVAGYTLQTGTTTKHSYVFPAGTVLAPRSYAAWYAKDTHLALSNTAGQARLIDTHDVVLDETASYEGADDGMTWAVIDNVWQWTARPTPAAENLASLPIIPTVTAVQSVVQAAPVATAAAKSVASTVKATTTKATAAVKSATTSTKSSSPTVKTTTAKKTTAAASHVASDARQVRGVHPLVLAGVVLAAVGYGLYEHRIDLANKLYQLRSHRATRRAHRS